MSEHVKLQEYFNSDVLHFGFREEVQYVLFPFADFTGDVTASQLRKTGTTAENHATSIVTVLVHHVTSPNNPSDRKTWNYPNTTIHDFLALFARTARDHGYPSEQNAVKDMLWTLQRALPDTTN